MLPGPALALENSNDVVANNYQISAVMPEPRILVDFQANYYDLFPGERLSGSNNINVVLEVDYGNQSGIVEMPIDKFNNLVNCENEEIELMGNNGKTYMPTEKFKKGLIYSYHYYRSGDRDTITGRENYEGDKISVSIEEFEAPNERTGVDKVVSFSAGYTRISTIPYDVFISWLNTDEKDIIIEKDNIKIQIEKQSLIEAYENATIYNQKEKRIKEEQRREEDMKIKLIYISSGALLLITSSFVLIKLSHNRKKSKNK